VSRRYVAALAGIAMLVLVAGLLTRRLLEPAEAPSTAPPSQATALQQLSMAGQLRRTAAFVAERAAEAAPFVVFEPASGASGVRLSGDTVLTTDFATVVRAVTDSAADSLRRVPRIAPDSLRRDWLLIVARDPSNKLLSTSALSGGRSSTDCAGRAVETYVLGALLDERFAGGGVFSVDGELLGMAAWCGGRVRAVPALELRRLLVLADTVAVPDSAATTPDSLTPRTDSVPVPNTSR
jgi:hypothetical protein